MMRSILCFILAAIFAAACQPKTEHVQEQSATFSNPVISGFAPDPSITRKGEDYYLVNSSFEYFPALPIYHSRDLVNWALIGHGVTEPDYIDLSDVESSGGIHAATIRYHEGRFHIVTTNIVNGTLTSFVITADNPAGPWSRPVIIEDAIGIDPSLFFDEDGRVWYTANRVPEQPDFPGQALIWIQEIDPETWQLIGERRDLWSGCCKGVWAEGPHIYTRGGTYYLLLSEGGTSFEHAISIAASDNVTGPYVGTPRNPVLTHRHLSFDHPITGVGHADLIETPDGQWYGVALGWRHVDHAHGILGRETFLFPVTWETEREWWKDPKMTFPVFSPLSGKIDLSYPMPFDGTRQNPRGAFTADFSKAELSPHWNSRRAPAKPFHTLNDDGLHLNLQPGRISERQPYSFLGVRQKDVDYEVTLEMAFTPTGAAEEAGLALMMNDRAALTLTRRRVDGIPAYELSRWEYGERSRIWIYPSRDDLPYLRLRGNGMRVNFDLSKDGVNWLAEGDDIDISFMSPAVLRGFNYTGLYVGLYGSSNGEPTSNSAVFKDFTYTPLGDRDAWYGDAN